MLLISCMTFTQIQLRDHTSRPADALTTIRTPKVKPIRTMIRSMTTMYWSTMTAAEIWSSSAYPIMKFNPSSIGGFAIIWRTTYQLRSGSSPAEPCLSSQSEAPLTNLPSNLDLSYSTQCLLKFGVLRRWCIRCLHIAAQAMSVTPKWEVEVECYSGLGRLDLVIQPTDKYGAIQEYKKTELTQKDNISKTIESGFGPVR